jgi:hypothetical protein
MHRPVTNMAALSSEFLTVTDCGGLSGLPPEYRGLFNEPTV